MRFWKISFNFATSSLHDERESELKLVNDIFYSERLVVKKCFHSSARSIYHDTSNHFKAMIIACQIFFGSNTL